MTITSQQIDQFSLFGEQFSRALEAAGDDGVTIAQGVLSNATNLADTIVTLADDERYSQAVSAANIFFQQAAAYAQDLAPDLVSEIEEVKASFEM